MSSYDLTKIPNSLKDKAKISPAENHDVESAVSGAEAQHSAAIESGDKEEIKRAATRLKEMREIRAKIQNAVKK